MAIPSPEPLEAKCSGKLSAIAAEYWTGAIDFDTRSKCLGTIEKRKRQALIDQAVRNRYPFMLYARNPFADPVEIMRVWSNDDMVLQQRPWIVDAIRAEFRRLEAEHG